jgi:hypothetical protein
MRGLILGVVIVILCLAFYIALDGPFLLRDWRNRKKQETKTREKVKELVDSFNSNVS